MNHSAVRRAIVLANGDVAARNAIDDAWPGWDTDVDLVVAADGGARHAITLGFRVDRWIGDGDSLPADQIERLREGGTVVQLVAHDKDESDTELAIDMAIAAGAAELVVLGAFGGSRLDHAIANITLLARRSLGGRPAVLLDAVARVRLAHAPDPAGAPVVVPLDGRVGDLVSLLPFGADVEGVRTSGLRYPLADEPLLVGAARGLSNVRVATDASVRLERGALIIVETPATLST